MSIDGKMNRRRLLKQAAGVVMGGIAFPYIIPARVLGADGGVAPSNRITMASIGVGWQGPANMEQFLQLDDCRVVTICDIDKNHLREAVNTVNDRYGNRDCAAYADYREVLARKDIDAVVISVPDHWHGIIAVAAAEAGKDIYGEKPLSHDFRQGRAICDAVRRYGRIWQTGSWQRSEERFWFACNLVRSGRIGKVSHVGVGLPRGHIDFEGTKGQDKFGPPPAELDYDTWLGPAPYAPYCPMRIHKNWRWNLDYGGGQLMDWVGHHVDVAHWALGLDYAGPVEVEGHGDYPPTGLWNSATEFEVTTKYAGGLTMLISSRISYPLGTEWHEVCGTKWFGENGWVCVTRGGIDAEPKSLLREKFGPNEQLLFESPGHWRNFLDCVKSRKLTIAPAEIAHRSATVGHLGQIAMLLGRKIRFNPQTEDIIDDPTATRLLGTGMRSPWHL
jgi:predicted dehydrogenase